MLRVVWSIDYCKYSFIAHEQLMSVNIYRHDKLEQLYLQVITKFQGQGQQIRVGVNGTKYLQTENKKPLKTVWPDCKAATKSEKIDWEQA